MKKKGFTLVELLAVIAILAILVLIVLPQVLTMFRKSKEDAFIIEARAVMNAARKKLADDSFKGDLEEKVYCSSLGEKENELEISGRTIYYMIHVINGRIDSYVISDNTEHTVFDTDENADFTADDIKELYPNVIEIKDCDFDYLMATGGINPDDGVSTQVYIDGRLVNVPYSGFTGYSCQISGLDPTPSKYFEFNKSTKTITKYYGEEKVVIIPCKIAGVRVENIGNEAFKNKKSIEQVIMPDTVKTIGDNAFSGCNINSLSLSNNITKIGCGAFYQNKLISVLFPKTLKEIGNTSCSVGTFEANPSLKGVRFQSNSIEVIGGRSFLATALSAVDMSSLTNLKKVGDEAFYGCGNLKAVRFSTNVDYIGKKAFYGTDLETLYLVSNKGVSIGEEAFANNKLYKITMKGVKSMGRNAFRKNDMPYSGAFIMNVDSSGKETGVLNSYAANKTADLTFPDKVKDISEVSFQSMELSGTLNTGNSIEIIPGGSSTSSGAFYGNKITKVVIGSNVKEIQGYAFQSNQIKEIEFVPGKLKKIGCGAFYQNKVENIVLPDSLVEFGEECSYGPFEGNNSLKTIKFGKNLEKIGNYAFYYNKLETVDFSVSSKLKLIGRYAFKGNQLKKVLLNGNNLTINYEAFANNKIEDVEIYCSNTSFDSNVFRSNSIKRLIIDGSNIKMGSEIFARNKISEFSMKGVTSLGSNAFRDNQMPDSTAFIMNVDSSGNPTTSLNSYGGAKRDNITIPSNVKTINSSAFENLGLTGTVNLGSLTKLPSRAFAHNKLTSVNLSNITQMDQNVFKDNMFPESTAFIMNKDSNGNSTGSLNSYAGANRENLVIPDYITSIDRNNFYYYDTSDAPYFYLTGTLTIGKGLTTIPSSTFYSQHFTNLVLGENVETIDKDAFRGSYVKTIEFNNKLKSIESGAFDTSQIVSLTLPDSVETLGGAENCYTFKTYKKDPENFTKSYGDWLTSTGGCGGAFSRISSLKTVTLGSGIKKIGASVFHGDTALASIDTSRANSLVNIEDFAFYNTKISRVDIPEPVLYIEDRTFAGNSALSEIFIKGKAELNQFSHLGIEWNGSCNNIKFELATCFHQSAGKITGYTAACSKNAKIPSVIDNTRISGISANAFDGLTLNSVYIPSSVMNIDDGAFDNANINYIMVEGKKSEADFTKANSGWNHGTHVIYSGNQLTCFKEKSGNIITGYYYDAPTNICNRNVNIPNTYKGVEENAFVGAAFNYINVADGTRFTVMGNNWNGSVEAVNFKGDSYDYNCFKLNGGTVTDYKDFCNHSVDFTKNEGKVQGTLITKIGNSAFKEKGLQQIKISDYITEIGDEAFKDNYELVSVTFVNKVNNDSSTLYKIGNSAFENTDLVSVNLPGALKVIGNNAFDDVLRLNKIMVLNKDSLDEFESLGNRWNGDCNNITFQRNQ